MKLFYLILPLLWFISHDCRAQETEYPSADPVMSYIDEEGNEVEDIQYDGSAPLETFFKAQPKNVGSYTPLYEWRFTKSGESNPFLIRYEENTDYVFKQSGSFTVELLISFVQGTDTIAYRLEEPFTVTLSESKLEVPNAFTPNGDGINDVFKVKDGYKSIISFKARIFNRWGKKLYEWTDLAGGWDGKAGGSTVPDGAYYLNIEARGADGKKYNIKKVINVLKGYTEGGNATE